MPRLSSWEHLVSQSGILWRETTRGCWLPGIKFVVTEELSVDRYRANFMRLCIMLHLARLSSSRLILRRCSSRRFSSSSCLRRSQFHIAHVYLTPKNNTNLLTVYCATIRDEHGSFITTLIARFVFLISGEAIVRIFIRIPKWTEKLDIIISKATNILKFREEWRDLSNRKESYAKANPCETVAREVFATLMPLLWTKNSDNRCAIC